MPIYKQRLTRKEEARYLEVAQDHAAAGARLDIPSEWARADRFLHLSLAPSPESLIYQLSPSKVLYVLRLRLVPERNTTVQEFEITTAWDRDVIPCYPDGRGLYQFASSLDFEFKEVLNHRIENFLRLRRGEIQEGFLLAMGLKPVPEEYGLGRPASVELKLLDQLCRPTVATVDLTVERSLRARKPSSRKRWSLFEPEQAPPAPMGTEIDNGLRLSGPPRSVPENIGNFELPLMHPTAIPKKRS
jgi:hypothetical protein